MLELLRRRGKYRSEDFARLSLAQPIELTTLKATWLAALERATSFVEARPPAEMGCLYYDTTTNNFVDPSVITHNGVVAHFGRPGGVLPRVLPT